jgi:hypothetical protein
LRGSDLASSGSSGEALGGNGETADDGLALLIGVDRPAVLHAAARVLALHIGRVNVADGFGDAGGGLHVSGLDQLTVGGF